MDCLQYSPDHGQIAVPLFLLDPGLIRRGLLASKTNSLSKKSLHVVTFYYIIHIEMSEALGFTRAVSLARRMKKLSLELYRGKQSIVPNTYILSRKNVPIRMLSDKVSKDGGAMIEVLMLAKAAYAADHLIIISDGGLLSKEQLGMTEINQVLVDSYRRRSPDVARSMMIIEATENYQNIGFCPYRLSQTDIEWLDVSEFKVDMVTEIVRRALITIMSQETFGDRVKEELLALAKNCQQALDINELWDQENDKTLKKRGYIVNLLS